MKSNSFVMLYAEGAGEAVSASLQLTSLGPLKIVHATVDWNCATAISSSMVSAEGGASSWEQLSMLISSAFGAHSARVVPALGAGSWRVAHAYLYFSTKKVSQTVRIAVCSKDWCAEFSFPGSRRNREEIKIPDDYRHLDVGDLLARLMMCNTSFKIFL